MLFRSHLQAAQAALGRRAQGLALTAWYWPLALPGVDVFAHPAAFLDQLVARLGAEPDAPATLPALVAHGVIIGAARWLVQHMDSAAVVRLVTTEGEQRGAFAGAAEADAPFAEASPVWLDTRGLQRVVPVPAALAPWLRTVLRSAGWRMAPGFTAPEVRASHGMAITAVSPTRATDQRGALPLTALPAPHNMPAPSPFNGSPDATQAGARPAAFPGAPARAPSTEPARPPWSADNELATLAGGLLFLLPVLERLGFAAWQAQHPEAPLCAPILRQALRRLRVPLWDPAWALLVSLPAPVQEDDLGVQVMARRWLVAVRRHLRRLGGLGLAEVCLRPGWLVWTDTHVDVHFVLAAAELRVRRLALDVDPGWLPWLNRVVAFHFQREAWA